MLAFIPPTVLSPLLSLFIFIVGHGLLSTLLTLRLNAEGAAAGWIGLVSSAYFAGLVLGAFVNVRLIQRIGHIRAYAAYASLLAGMAFNNANLGYVHAMAHQLGGLYDMPHGVANAVLLPHVARYNLIANPEKFADIAEFMGSVEYDDPQHSLPLGR